jgi:hypothetical protein
VPKSDLPSGPDYAPVAYRIALFYERYPDGRIITHLTLHNEREIMFRASVYRDARTRWPAATGWASERVGDGDINTVACLENTETSAIGRALANLGFTASKYRPSAEEMLKAARARASRVAEGPHNERPQRREQRANVTLDILSLLRAARRLGFPQRRMDVIAGALREGVIGSGRVDRLARDIRAWIARRQRIPRCQPVQGTPNARKR